MRAISRPKPGEYAPYVVEYFRLVPEGNVLEHMMRSVEATPEFFRAIPTDMTETPHHPGEWTVKEILQHIADDERIYAYRALRFARNDSTELPSFEQDDFAAHSEANGRTLPSLIDEFVSVRLSTLSLFEGFPESALTRQGVANGNPMSVRAAAYHILGHELHHLDSIRANYLTH